MRSGVKDIDRGLKELRKRFREVNGAYVKVGVTSDVGSQPKKERTEGGGVEDGPLTLVEVAWFNEFGTTRKTKNGGRVPHVPARSFVRSTADEQRARVANMTRALSAKILRRELSVAEALKLIGEFMQAQIQRKITKLKEPPNAPSTIAAKGSSNPLIDIGQLRQNIRYEVFVPLAGGAGGAGGGA